MESVLLDLDSIAELEDLLGQVAVGSLLKRFIIEVDEMFELVTQSNISSCSLQDVMEEIHRVSGSAALLGIAQMHVRLSYLEKLGREADIRIILKKLGDLEEVWVSSKARMVALGLLTGVS